MLGPGRLKFLQVKAPFEWSGDPAFQTGECVGGGELILPVSAVLDLIESSAALC